MIENFLGSKVKIRVLRFFFEFPFVKRNLRELSAECKQGLGALAEALKSLVDVGILEKEKVGREELYYLNKNSELFKPLKKLFEIEKRKFPFPIVYRNLLGDVLTSTKRYSKSIVLFGSLVSGDFTSKSDVDLLFISNDEETIRKRCMEIENKYGIKIQPIVINESETGKFKKTKLYKTIIRESIVLCGKNFFKERLK